ncbi:hypothetical protein TNCV_889781 [Trichonephila clavipes]|nr:hypothetical protein TNCV_889781 [Trichonephila clavipes]
MRAYDFRIQKIYRLKPGSNLELTRRTCYLKATGPTVLRYFKRQKYRAPSKQKKGKYPYDAKISNKSASVIERAYFEKYG